MAARCTSHGSARTGSGYDARTKETEERCVACDSEGFIKRKHTYSLGCRKFVDEREKGEGGQRRAFREIQPHARTWDGG